MGFGWPIGRKVSFPNLFSSGTPQPMCRVLIFECSENHRIYKYTYVYISQSVSVGVSEFPAFKYVGGKRGKYTICVF